MEQANVPLIDIPTLRDIVKHQVIRKGNPVMIKGMSGIGKSDAITQVVEEEGALKVDVRLSHYESVDLHGFPAINKTTGFSQWHPMSALPFIGNDAFPDDRDIVVFFDELNHGRDEVLAVCYQIMLEFRIGEFVLKPRTKIVCAMNGTAAKGYGRKLPSPLCDRMKWFELVFSLPAWTEHLARIGKPQIFGAFHHWKHGELVNTFDPKNPQEVFATPRSWVSAMDDYSDPDLPQALKVLSMAGTVGEGPNNEFWGFVDVWHKVVKLKAVIRDPLGTPLPDEESFKYATAVYLGSEMTAANVAQVYKYLRRLDPEYTVLAWQLAVARDGTLYDVPEYLQYAQQYRAVYQR